MKKTIAILLCFVMTITCVPSIYASETQESSTVEVVAPVSVKATATTITLMEVEGYEYSNGGETWQTSPLFENLEAYTVYTFYQRNAEKTDEISPGKKIRTRKHEAEAPSAPTLDFVSDTLIRVKRVAGYEYSRNGTSWNNYYAYGGLEPETEYTFYQRTAETKTHYASPASPVLVVKTKKSGEESVAPIVIGVTDTTITLKKVEGYEYSLDNVTWQDSNVLSVEPLSEYTIYQRIKETDDSVAGTSISTKAFTQKATVVPEGYKGIYTKEDLSQIRENPDGKYILMNSLEFTDSDFSAGGDFNNDGKGWIPIGGYKNEFTGIFNGNGYYIDGLYINQDINDYYGLFGINKGTIRNLGVTNCELTSIVEEYEESEFVKTSNHVGAVAGSNQGKIITCYVSGELTGKCFDKDLDNYVGGIAAKSNDGGIINCFNEATILSMIHSSGYNYSNAGGICGKGAAENSYNMGLVYAYAGTGIATVGGVSPSSSNINCYSIDLINDERQRSSYDGNTMYLSELQMATKNTYKGFDFDNIWKLDGNIGYPYPILRNVEHKEFEGDGEYAGGKGTAYDPYIIKNEKQLKNITKNMGAHYELANDIELDGSKDWEPIGTTPYENFHGSFDGKGHVISNVQIDRKTDKVEAVGLFGYSAGLIKRIGVINGSVKLTVTCAEDITNMNGYAGGIVGYNGGVILMSYNGNKVAAIQAEGSEPTSLDAGGIAGYSNIIRNSYNFGNVIASGGFAEAAGIAADVWSKCIESCYNCGKVVYDVNSTAEALGIGNSSVMNNVYSLPVSNLHRYERKTVFLTEEDMKNQESFSGFDFEKVWEFNSNYDYPQLKAVKHIHSPENKVEFAGGRGTKSEPYILKTAKHLVNAAKYPDAYFVLQDNIDMSDEVWEPFGKDAKDPFLGTFDGNGFAVEGICIGEAETTGANTGFVGYNAGVIKNIAFNGGTMKKINGRDSKTSSGIVCGYNSITGVIKDVSINDTKLVVAATIGDNAVGGIAGHNRGKITTSNFGGNVDVSFTELATGETGGLVGHNHMYGTITKNYNDGIISGSNYHETKKYTYWAGLVGYNDGKLHDCYNIGDMQIINPKGTATNTYVSLMVGYMEDKCSVKNIYHCATSTVENITRRSNVYYLGSPKVFENVYFVNTLSTLPVKGVALTPEEMMEKSNYKGFNFDGTWFVDNEGAYKLPQLRDNPYALLAEQNGFGVAIGNHNEEDYTPVSADGVVAEDLYDETLIDDDGDGPYAPFEITFDDGEFLEDPDNPGQDQEDAVPEGTITITSSDVDVAAPVLMERVYDEVNDDYYYEYQNDLVATSKLYISDEGFTTQYFDLYYTGVGEADIKMTFTYPDGKKVTMAEFPVTVKGVMVCFEEDQLVYNGKEQTADIIIMDWQNRLVSEDNYTITYLGDKTTPGEQEIQIAFDADYSGYQGELYTYYEIVPKAPANVYKRLVGHDDIKVSWSKSVGADGYYVYYKKSGGTYQLLKRVTGTYATASNLTDGAKYYFKVVPYVNIYGERVKSPKCNYSTYIYTLKKISTPKLSKSGTKVKVRWTNISGETGYQISRSTKKTGTNIVATYKTTSGKSKLVTAKKGTKYYYKVRAYNRYKLNGKTVTVYGPWSETKAYRR